MEEEHQRPQVLTWHIHGNYLLYLTQADADFYLPVKRDGTHGYGGRAGDFPWGNNVHEVNAQEVKDLDLDLILFQSPQNYQTDQFGILSVSQRSLPKIYIEHDPPRKHPTDTHHVVDDPDVLLVHVTHFNDLMWNSNATPTKVIPHGIMVPGKAEYTGEKDRGVVVVNNLEKRGRRLGLDIFEQVRKEVPVDLVGMNSKEVGGLGELPYDELHYFTSQYRFFFNPIRYTSLGLAVCEAMMIGLPIIGMATTEMTVTIENGESGFVHTDLDFLIEKMKHLIEQPEVATAMGQKASSYASRNFSIHRFSKEWEETFSQVLSNPQFLQHKEVRNEELN